jgi:hypothetical protein
MPRQKRPKRPGPAAKPDAEPGPHHIADEPVGEVDSPDAKIQNPVTETGLPVEEQIRKEWDPNRDGGLPNPLRNGAR